MDWPCQDFTQGSTREQPSIHAAKLFHLSNWFQTCLSFKILTVLSHVGLLILIAHKKSFEALNATQKNPSSLQSTISEKSRKTCKNSHFEHYWPLWPFLFYFFKNGTLHRAEVFALYSVHQTSCFDPSKLTIRHFFYFSSKVGPI